VWSELILPTMCSVDSSANDLLNATPALAISIPKAYLSKYNSQLLLLKWQT